MTPLDPSRGEVWYVDLNPAKGRKQAGLRPGLVISVDPFNHSPADLVVILPMRSRRKGIPLHVPLTAPEGGLRQPSYIKCEDIRSVSKERLVRRLGSLGDDTLVRVEERLRLLLGI